MALPRWIPRRADAPGLALVALVAAASIALVRALPRSPFLSEVLVAMVLGALVRNSAAGRALHLGESGDRASAGIAYACSGLLRVAIVVMGLKVSTSIIGGGDLLLVLGACAASIPSAFFVAHALGRAAGLGRPMRDVLGAGSAICGASAVNATAPIVGADRQEQGLAVGVVFVSSVIAMLAFRAVAHAAGLSSHDAGVWAGLAVNDLSSAVSVGAQMGGDGGVMAAAAKSTRILMMAPMLVILSLLRRDARSAAPRGSLAKSIAASLPGFILGYVALAAMRALGDHALGDAAAWKALLVTAKHVVEGLLAAVSAGIGLSLALRTLLAQSTAAAIVSISTSMFLAALTLGVVVLATRVGAAAATVAGIAALAGTFFALRVARGTPRATDTL